MAETYITTDTDGTPLAVIVPDPDQPGRDQYYLLRHRKPAPAAPTAETAQPSPAD